MIGIIGAMQIEIDGLRANMTNAKEVTISGVDFLTGEIKGKEVVVAMCGMGKVFAAITAQTMAIHFNVDAMLNTGVAGNLSDKLGIKSVAIADQVVQHDMDLTPIGFEYGQLGGIDKIYLPCDQKLVALIENSVKEMGLNYQVGTIATGDQFINKPEQQQFITGQFGAIAAEMEGASIGHVCYINNVPFAIIRTISDDADGNSPEDFPAFAKEAAEIAIDIVLNVIEHL